MGSDILDTWGQFQAIIDSLSYKPHWRFETGFDGGRLFVQVKVAEGSESATDPFTGQRKAWAGAKVYLSVHMCKQEVVGAAYGAVQRAELHEAAEWFRYHNQPIYSHHLDPDALLAVAQDVGNYCLRT